MADTISFRPTDQDVAAIEALKKLHPFLVSTTDVLRFSLHMTHRRATQTSDDPAVSALVADLEAEMPDLNLDQLDLSDLPPNPMRDALLARLRKAERKPTK